MPCLTKISKTLVKQAHNIRPIPITRSNILKNEPKPLIDTFKRRHRYLRLSLTDRCNFKCNYCMPESQTINNKDFFAKNENLLTSQEIGQISRIFVEKFGFNKIRLTGGEPTLRGDFSKILKNFDDEIFENVTFGISTNGLLIHRYFEELVERRFVNINLSLDSLSPGKASFIANTDRKLIEKTFDNFYKILLPAAERGIINLKVNVVVINKFNEDELINFKNLAKNHPIQVRFLEYMPFSGNNWERNKVISEAQILTILNDQATTETENRKHEKARKHDKKQIITRLPPETPFDVAKFYTDSSDENFKGTLGFISTITSPFCSGCNRIRVTADGFMKNCLFSENEIDLKTVLRGQKFSTKVTKINSQEQLEERLISIISENVKLKKFSRDLNNIGDRPMVRIGG